MDQLTGKELPKALTSYDVLKSLAIILMIIDHFGLHFYPDEMWFRTIGRLCVPIWFFLIGYANTITVPKTFWLAALIVTASALVSGQFLLPLNIMFTIMIVRYLRQKGVMNCLNSAEALRGMFFIILLLALPSSIIVEYGTTALFFAIIGYIVRHRETVNEAIKPAYTRLFAVLSFLTFFILQGLNMPYLHYDQALFLLFGFTFVGIGLWLFKPLVFVDAPKYMALSLIRILQFLGRRTLEIYVVHIVIFRAIAMVLDPEGYGFMDWDIVPMSMVAIFI